MQFCSLFGFQNMATIFIVRGETSSKKNLQIMDLAGNFVYTKYIVANILLQFFLLKNNITFAKSNNSSSLVG